MTEPRLFDPKTTSPRRCTHPDCEAGTRKNLCRHDWLISEGAISTSRRRPKSCLNAQPAYDPRTAPFPEGY